MAAGMLMPMVRFAIDPVLQKKEGGDFVLTEQENCRYYGSSRTCRLHLLNKWMHGTSLM